MVPPVDGFPGEGRVLGSVHHWVSNLSFGSGAQGPLRFTGSPVHVSAPFEARAPGPVSSQLSSNDGLEEPFKVVLVSCRLSPAGIRFLDILFPPENSALLTVGLPTRHQGGPDSVGVPMFRTHEMRPGWVPPLPRGGGVLPTSAASPIGACRFPTASPIPRCNLPPAELLITGHTKIHSRSPVRSSPRPSPPGGTGALRLSPWASHPAVAHDARQVAVQPW